MFKAVRFFWELCKHSKIVAWIFAILEAFWFAQLIRDEFMSAEFAARHRIVDLLPHTPLATWAAATSALVLAIFVEGGIRWYVDCVEPFFGKFGSLAYRATETAGVLFSCVAEMHGKFGSCPTISSADQESTARQWRWQSRLSKIVDAEAKPRVRAVYADLEREGLYGIDVQHVISLATVSEVQVISAAVALVEMSWRLQAENRNAENPATF